MRYAQPFVVIRELNKSHQEECVSKRLLWFIKSNLTQIETVLAFFQRFGSGFFMNLLCAFWAIKSKTFKVLKLKGQPDSLSNKASFTASTHAKFL